MKVVAILENSITAGGGFNQALNAILQMQKICKGQFEFEVFTSRSENIISLEKLGVNAVVFSLSFVDKLLAKLSLNVWWQSIQSRIKYLGPFEKKLMARGCNLVYFVTPSVISPALQKLNYIVTVWDLCHRDRPEFPEVRNFNQFYARDHYYQNHLSPAVVVLTDSEQLADNISHRYGVDRERLLPMPFAPAPFLERSELQNDGDVLKKYGLERGYFFYPAQFWAHKNHIRILEALILLKERGIQFNVVFAGGDFGNRVHIERFVNQNKLKDQVHFLGFVAAEDMRGLYESCKAVIMPTYFGPTNLPPLEAWMFGKPLIYSLPFGAQAGNAARLVNPDDAHDLASAMNECSDTLFCNAMIQKGSIRLQEINAQRRVAEDGLLLRLMQFEKRQRCMEN
ncbi:glycosyltransferase family 4 protein [Herminiimonas arsenitoxidans]|uniref:glycosyltransferase family 4 protein n=1 Tax=Herminiimonas arsenitoxidans TaxID=1809410 RepID=UPI000970B4B4|nr:glycosyltransferase family 1 protein [Herminiimonas arsenitoxidans]